MTNPRKNARRSFLKGALAAGACAALPAAHVGLGAGTRVTAQDTPNGAGLGSKKRMVLLLAAGGWDPTYNIDPKPGRDAIDVPEGAMVQRGGITIWSSSARPNVDGYFTRYGADTVVLNGLQTRSFVHSDCMKRVLTGSPSETTPDFCAITAFEHAAELPVPYLALGAQARSGPLAAITGRTGSVNQLSALVDPSARYPFVGEDDRIRPDLTLNASPEENDLVRAYLSASATRLGKTRGQRGYNRRRIDDFVDSLTRADRLRDFAQQYGLGGTDYTLDIAVQVPLAVSALRDGLSHTVTLEVGGWDSHQNNAQQATQHEALFGALTALVDGLASQQMLDDTLVVVLSEMGRTPRLNGQMGKDHWPVTSAMLVGAGVRGGRVLGGTTDGLDAALVDLSDGALDPTGQQLEASHLVAGLLAHCGVDPTHYVGDVTPFRAFSS